MKIEPVDIVDFSDLTDFSNKSYLAGYRAGRESMRREAVECVWQGSTLPMLEEGENWTQDAVDAVATVRKQMLDAIEALDQDG